MPNPVNNGSPLLLSSKNSSVSKSTVVAKKTQYADFDLNMYVDKELTKGDIVPLTDLDAVKNAVRNILLSNSYDRPFQPRLGANLRRHLFEPADQFTTFALKQDIKIALENYEPRIDQVNVIANFDEDANQYIISLAFRVITPNQRTDMTIRLSRLR